VDSVHPDLKAVFARHITLPHKGSPHVGDGLDHGPPLLLQPVVVAGAQELVPVNEGDIGVEMVLVVRTRACPGTVSKA
jgi:hypothetical protein